jgi:hypothetical protein
LPEYFVWSTPALIRLIDAADAQTAAGMFTEQPVSPVPVLGQLPVCFVQASGFSVLKLRVRSVFGERQERMDCKCCGRQRDCSERYERQVRPFQQ